MSRILLFISYIDLAGPACFHLLLQILSVWDQPLASFHSIKLGGRGHHKETRDYQKAQWTLCFQTTWGSGRMTTRSSWSSSTAPSPSSIWSSPTSCSSGHSFWDLISFGFCCLVKYCSGRDPMKKKIQRKERQRSQKNQRKTRKWKRRTEYVKTSQLSLIFIM